MNVQGKEIVINMKTIIFMDYHKLALEYLIPEQITPLKYKMSMIFKDFLKYKLWKYELHKDLDNRCMAQGERVCLNLSFLVAVKQFTPVNLVMCIDNPLDYLDPELRKGVLESQAYSLLMSGDI